MGVKRKTLSGIVGLIIVVVAAVLGVNHAEGDGGGSAPTGSVSGAVSGARSGSIAVSSLPSQAREVLDEIDHGGPFEYPRKDGSVFGNYEGMLPHESSGYYHEYTVDTPGASTRGTRRIITGRNGELYWTADHYNTFQRISR